MDRLTCSVVCFLCALISVPGAIHARQAAEQYSRSQAASLRAVKRIYVEQFALKQGSIRLRGDIIAQLRKLSTIALVTTASQADAILTGEGEIWVRGYQSLNPRSGRLPYDGQPIYSGFLSVELKDVKGETLWSYLITPGPPSEQITKDLSKRLEKQLAEAIQGTGPRP